MKSVPVEGATRRLSAPKGWNHETQGICHTLEIVDHDGWMTSAWLPTPNELARLNAGMALVLSIQGHPTTQHPVVSLGVCKPAEPESGV